MNFRVTQRTSKVSEIQNSETQDDDRRKTRNERTKGRKANGMKEVVLVVLVLFMLRRNIQRGKLRRAMHSEEFEQRR